MKLRKIIPHRETGFFEVIPGPIWGWAYEDHLRRVSVWYPIPLNYVVQLVRWMDLKWAMFRGRWSTNDDMIAEAIQQQREEAYRAGFDAGEDQGRRLGWEQGYAQAKKVIADEVENRKSAYKLGVRDCQNRAIEILSEIVDSWREEVAEYDQAMKAQNQDAEPSILPNNPESG